MEETYLGPGAVKVVQQRIQHIVAHKGPCGVGHRGGNVCIPDGLGNAIVNELKTAISEAVTNAIVHGYTNDESKSVYMNLSYDNYNIYAEVIDYGIGISDIEQAQEPLFTTKKDEERSGLGFTIMNVFTDELDVISRVNEGTKITMVKNYIMYKS